MSRRARRKLRYDIAVTDRLLRSASDDFFWRRVEAMGCEPRRRPPLADLGTGAEERHARIDADLASDLELIAEDRRNRVIRRREYRFIVRDAQARHDRLAARIDAAR